MDSAAEDERRALVKTSTSSGSPHHRDEQGSSYRTFTNTQLSGDNVHREQVDADVEKDDPGYTWAAIFMIMSSWIGVFLASAGMSVFIRSETQDGKCSS